MKLNNMMKPFSDFDQASNAILDHLHRTLGFDLWMVTRTEGKDWIVLNAHDQSYGVSQGDLFTWTDSFCSRMVKGLGPRIAPCSHEVPAYVEAPIGQQVPIGAYVGVPLIWEDGNLFGTLCAIHPTPRPRQIANELPLVELFARLLSTILHSELKTNELTRETERAAMDAMTDSLTGLYNRRGWERLVETEQARSERYGHPTGVVSIDIDYLKAVNDELGHASGDEMIRRAGEVIAAAVRSQDVVARLGGDEFAVLAVECDRQGAEQILSRIKSGLDSAVVPASIGFAMCEPGVPFSVTWEIADQDMYVNKRNRPPMPRSLVANA